jgi:hypothetical protein
MKSNHLRLVLETSLKNGGDIQHLPPSIQESIDYCNAFEYSPQKRSDANTAIKPKKSVLMRSINEHV